MSDKKLFVVLEQGQECNTDISKKHKEQFSTEFSDWFRLNWMADRNDKEAHFYKDKITWSEGRSYLYEQVRGKYEYYIFIDDDVEFSTPKKNKTVAEHIKYFFEEYNPITGTFYGENYAFLGIFEFIPSGPKEVFRIMKHDLMTHYFQEDFAELMFPNWFPGSEASMWYAQYIGFKNHPLKCLCYRDIFTTNRGHRGHFDRPLPQFVPKLEIIEKSSQLFKNETDRMELISWADKRSGERIAREQNIIMYHDEIEPNKDKKRFNRNVFLSYMKFVPAHIWALQKQATKKDEDGKDLV